MSTGKPALNHLTGVEQQVPAVGDLHGPGSAHGDAARVLGRAIARHELDLRLTSEPSSQGRSRAVRQETDGTSAFKVDQKGGVGPPLAQGPVIDTNHVRPGLGRERQATNTPQQRSGAGRHGEMCQEPGRGCAAEREAGTSVRFGQPVCSLRMTAKQVWQGLGEGPASAGRMMAVEAPDYQVQAHGLAADGQVGRSTTVATMG